MTPSARRTGTPRPSIPGRILFAALTALLWIGLPGTPGARAEAPVPLSPDGRSTERVGVPGAHEPRTETAPGRSSATRRLPVAYVPGFSARDRPGRRDALPAPVPHDRRYARTAGQGSPLPTARLRGEASRTAEPAGDPAAAPGAPDRGSGNPTGVSGNVLVPLVVLVVAGVLAALTFGRRRRRTRTRTTPGRWGMGTGVGRWGDGTDEAVEPPVPLPLPDLDARAEADLVDTDDAVRTSEEELGFVTARFGEEAAAPFAGALRHAEGELAAAFRLRQQLDDALPEDDAARRRMLDGIVTRCADANGRLDAVSEDFDRLRALERTAPQAVAAAAAVFRELTARAAASEAALGAMRDRYAPSASAPAAGDLGQARDRLAFTAGALDEARRAVDRDDDARAAVYVRAAEGAVGQAATLLDAVDRRSGELAGAEAALPDALTGTETELADTGRLLDGTPEDVPTADLRAGAARARAVVDEVGRELAAGPYDPVEALRRVVEAHEALAGARERGRDGLRARSLLDGAALTARAAVDGAEDYVTTHRGAIGSQARTRLAEARRRWERAGELSAADDPRGALAEVRQAEALAAQARDLAERDVRVYRDRDGYGGPRGKGGPEGAVLGGILLSGGLGGGAGGPGSFGGGGTRGRRGGDGRF
ncbi:TPM domain-containing protein [Streptomyces sp. NPDC058008]|uniref:TPM domain-containing protein n=1 Tax=Streptomyces sp. NPDC058008 TaxID=3346303 RepID=UPI0036E31F76